MAQIESRSGGEPSSRDFYLYFAKIFLLTQKSFRGVISPQIFPFGKSSQKSYDSLSHLRWQLPQRGSQEERNALARTLRELRRGERSSLKQLLSGEKLHDFCPSSARFYTVFVRAGWDQSIVKMLGDRDITVPDVKFS